MRVATISAAVLSICTTASAFSQLPQQLSTTHRHSTAILATGGMSRRSFGTAAALLTTTSVLFPSTPALAIPMITTDEFLLILRDSAPSIKVVEFSGPQSETVTVRLVDGTAFGLKDVIESPIDPRSPLKVAAACRANRVPTTFANLEAILAAAPKRKKAYANERVQLAGEKEKEKQARLAQDEENRLAELYRMQQQQ